ncbi:hypothetical protein [Lutispora saccharofermentans]|uniref:Lipoprotein n=1 Tax=Lutispora saccharofermentans TaxID=3024236 RepID=A0ABT1NIY0_9FIRM|nr:hypothetical protein [Lutispora saccharofermentans]MCQ1530539.1 hypothetical protein [Lutispora saccharofermentans]
MKHRMLFTLITILLLIFCSGCGNKPFDNNNSPNPSAQTSRGSTDESKENKDNLAVNNPETFDELSERCQLNGSVTEFSDSGCTISPTVYEGDLAYAAAPENESRVKQVIVTYDESCTFQIVQVSLSTGAMTYEDATIDDVKKQTGLFVAGEYDGESILHAEQVYIYRMVE